MPPHSNIVAAMLFDLQGCARTLAILLY